MKFIVKPQEKRQERGKAITLCAQCKENPRFCYEW
jgi:hypothetical protein